VGYLHIENLYKNKKVLEFPELYVMEKVHGTSAHIKFKNGQLTFFSGGEKYENFLLLFNVEFLTSCLLSLGMDEVVIFGEAYGGKQQGMSATYGKDLKFVAFDATLNGVWLTVPNAEQLVKFCKLEFVHYVKIKTSLEAIDQERDADSVQAIRNGVGIGKKREGVVLRPLEEFVDEYGDRIIAKHKRADFQETKTPREVSAEELKILSDAKAIADEWVTPMRLQHVLDKARNIVNFTNTLPGMGNTELGESDTGTIIQMMVADVEREAKGEILKSKEARKEISRRTACMYKEWLRSNLKGVSHEEK
jgi:hypothetical protein